ncbi:hypothetical protein J0X19_13910 [Hymenobacter sp. BT186]|uniref:Uncharacterized protein n=1 Tax=Hymenobacter telluris TaxID=2816474 RepID=A0A939JD57_9BACT|nr:hypothetical protein [Hymenobacter telluris]MBO0359050.1 hypothetical protein [Hymenobacter telluris]MBW3375076.1 hypothetical protein [Hymenobacter norwichensis]
MLIRVTEAPVASLTFTLPIATFVILFLLGCGPLLSAGIAFACIGAAWLVQSGLEIDLAQGMQRTYYTALGFSVGQWKPLAPVVGITLKYFSSIQPNTTPSSRRSWGVWNDASQRTEEVIVMLSIAHSSTGMIIKTLPLSEMQEAIAFAKDLAEQLGVPLHTYIPAHIQARKS